MKRYLPSIILILTVSCSTMYAQKKGITIPDMIQVEGGTFMMGSNSGNENETPAHKVMVSSFSIGKYEVTFGEYKIFVDSTGYKTDAEQHDTVRIKQGLPPREKNHGTWNRYATGIPVTPTDTLYPVANISWNDAMAYCSWLSKKTGKKFRLPTEAEWEFVAKGGIKSKGFNYAGGNNLDEVAWHIGNSRIKLHMIGKKTPNELGIYDMSGNIEEWCADWYSDSYFKTSPEKNPAGPGHGTYRVLRGGSWRSGESRMTITFRNHELPFNNALVLGFRLALSGEYPDKK
ncbi:MAG: formylglycine-generating enzyme family protein [Bacteroidales bacterium]|nr:formylglycine-generating enzyme family protein [Bacteroidales bacterium]